ncbi:hypothetical protein V2G26_018057 [Clonostachys chloroleuca]
MSTNFRDRAIAEVQKAITADHNKEYQKAFDLYMSSMELWVKALKWEKNKALKATMQEKMATYLDRAEKLKQFLAAEAENTNDAGGGKGLMGANGGALARARLRPRMRTARSCVTRWLAPFFRRGPTCGGRTLPVSKVPRRH